MENAFPIELHRSTIEVNEPIVPSGKTANQPPPAKLNFERFQMPLHLPLEARKTGLPLTLGNPSDLHHPHGGLIRKIMSNQCEPAQCEQPNPHKERHGTRVWSLRGRSFPLLGFLPARNGAENTLSEGA